MLPRTRGIFVKAWVQGFYINGLLHQFFQTIWILLSRFWCSPIPRTAQVVLCVYVLKLLRCENCMTLCLRRSFFKAYFQGSFCFICVQCFTLFRLDLSSLGPWVSPTISQCIHSLETCWDAVSSKFTSDLFREPN